MTVVVVIFLTIFSNVSGIRTRIRQGASITLSTLPVCGVKQKHTEYKVYNFFKF